MPRQEPVRAPAGRTRIPPVVIGAASADAGETPRCLFPNALPAHITDRYRALALVVTPAHVERLDPADEDVLIVCCDWLLWQRLIGERRHAVHYELGLLDWDGTDSLNTDLFNHANDWILDIDGGDPSVFRDVSLGRLFGAEMTMAVMNFHRLNRSLRSLIRRFHPRELWFYDFKYDINHLTPALRRHIVRLVAGDCAVGFVDRSKAPLASDHGKALATYRLKDHGRLARMLLAIYAFVIEAATRLRRAFGPPGNRVLVLVNTNMAVPLVRGFAGGRLTPMFLGRTIPKRPGLLWRCLARGILLVNPWPASLTAADSARVVEIRDALDRATSRAADGMLAFAHAYVRENVLDLAALREAAEEVTMAASVLDRLQPRRIVVDGIRSRRHLAYAELARARGIAVDYIWHAPLTPQNMKTGGLGGDPRQPTFVSRCLSWGRTNEEWLRRVGAQTSVVRVGSPLRDKFIRDTRPAASRPARTGAERNVLVLQYGFNVLDLAGVNANMYGTFVNLMRMLRRLGYANVRFKMHPGPGRWQKSYFAKIADFFGVTCDILQYEPFEACLEWADVVIGPSHTGAMFETLAAGKPYHALMLPPHNTFDVRYFEGFPLINSLDQLPDALERDTDAAGRKLLDDLYATDEIANPSERFWQVLADDVRRKDIG